MAERAAVQVRIGSSGRYDGEVITWSGLLTTDTGAAVGLSHAADRSVQVTGTFGAAGHMHFKGSNDGTNYVDLTDPQGNALDFTAAGIEAISELTRYVKPVGTGGDGTTSLEVTFFGGIKR